MKNEGSAPNRAEIDAWNLTAVKGSLIVLTDDESKGLWGVIRHQELTRC